MIALMVAVLAAFPTAQEVPADPHAAHALAVEAYRSGDLGSARAFWTAALEGSPQSPPAIDRAALLFDLGNVAYREGKLLEAAAWYTSALEVSPRFEDAWKNLEFVRGEAGLEAADRGDLGATVSRLLHWSTLAESEWMVLACSLLLALALAFEALRGGALARRLAWSTAGLLLISLAPWVATSKRAERDPLFVVAQDGASVLSEPRADATAVARIEPGLEVERVDGLPEWVRVELDGGQRGWVERDAVFALRR